jgi:hypothetical protein
MKEELFKGLTEEQVAKIKACKSQEEVLKVAKEEGVELNDEQLEAVSGGCSRGGLECPYCYNHNTVYVDREGDGCVYLCKDCNQKFKTSSLV